MVMQNNVMKYITNIGQNTGMLNTSKNVHKIPMTVLFEIAYQNLNSGNRRMNGRNSWFDLVGSSGPCSSKKTKSKYSEMQYKSFVIRFCLNWGKFNWLMNIYHLNPMLGRFLVLKTLWTNLNDKYQVHNR